jgi:hypothetical protein
MQKIQPSSELDFSGVSPLPGYLEIVFQRGVEGSTAAGLESMLSGPYFRLALLAGSLEDRATGKKGCSTGQQPHFESTPGVAHLIT